MEHFGVASVLRIRLVVIDQELELGQELRVEYSVRLVLLLQNVRLDQFENVASDSFHWLEHGHVAGVAVNDEL